MLRWLSFGAYLGLALADLQDVSSSLLTPRAEASDTVTVKSIVLVIAAEPSKADCGSAGLLAYGIPHQKLILPKDGLDLVSLNDTATLGNYGAILVMSDAQYLAADGRYPSALSSDQWATLYAYQANFGVRMVRIDVWPTEADFGVKLINGSCCRNGGEQFISISNTTGFESAGLVQ